MKTYSPLKLFNWGSSTLNIIQALCFWTNTAKWELNSRVRKSRYWGEMLLSPIHCCDVTNPPYLLSGKLCTSPLHSNRLFVYTVCCRRRGQCFSVLRTSHTDVVGDSSGRSYVTEQWHNVPLLRTRGLNSNCTTSMQIHTTAPSNHFINFLHACYFLSENNIFWWYCMCMLFAFSSIYQYIHY